MVEIPVGVILEVVELSEEASKSSHDICTRDCYFGVNDIDCGDLACEPSYREDKKNVYFFKVDEDDV